MCDNFDYTPTSKDIEKELTGGKSHDHEQGLDDMSSKVPDETIPANNLTRQSSEGEE